MSTYKTRICAPVNPILDSFLSPHLYIMSYRPEFQTDSGLEGGANPFTTRTSSSPGSAGSATEVLRLRLQAQELLTRALEVENSTLRGEVVRLQGRIQARDPPIGDRFVRRQPEQRPLAERIDLAVPQPPPVRIVSGRGRAFPRAGPPLPPTVAVRPVDIHPRFLPLGENFQEGGTGGPAFSRPQDWPDAIYRNPSARPRGVRRWGTHPVNLDDLHVYTQLGQLVYGGNRPPGRRDPVEPQRPWKAIEAAFFRGTVAIILRPHVFTEVHNQLTPEERALYRLPFLTAVGDPNHLATRDIAQHLIRSGITKSWTELDVVVGYARSYLRDWARHQPEITTATDLGQLFITLYPAGISRQDDRHYIEDAEVEDDAWGGNLLAGAPMDEGDDDMPPLVSVTPTPPQSPRAITPEDERLDWGEDEL